ncbi:hypothetical protein BTA35_0200125 [Oceanospirillum linum]|uniref:FAD dependent oxidoreductase domain-containing protein n=1 Tax=Oceanospirillum linum TaxID=966 RepID=A0A1T1HDX3_OCELI|nr:FAD-dependent oxidoreductase [Oceanospirillum linum]OOV88006.1 hypothetical protein BTA35_0200125 [Oceanospirillum linum]SEF40194.1 FAD dependent oxidoreductase [Oleiphilus messinensis]SMP00438.1 FAD dependent oxidoreductase [Oceanospirillum linum]
MTYVSFPHYQRLCGWGEPAESPASRPRLTGHHQCDVVVVGAGYTGISAARQLAQLRPQDSILLLEADQVGGALPAGTLDLFCRHR